MSAAAQQSESRSPRLLRYRFDSSEQVARHFHAAAGRVVLFYPTLLRLEAGEPVILEVAFARSEQRCILQGSVLAPESAAPYASWLAFSAQGVVAGLRSAAAIPKRGHRRFPTDLVIELRPAAGPPFVSKLLDVSAGGGRLAGSSFTPSTGERVQLGFYSSVDRMSVTVAAEVAWARAGEVGIRFPHPSPAERLNIAGLVERFRKNLLSAHEAAHPGICKCMEGRAVVEPPLPRSALDPAAPR
jgi:hypothetical protein